jgi:hypothetical protein
MDAWLRTEYGVYFKRISLEPAKYKIRVGHSACLKAWDPKITKKPSISSIETCINIFAGIFGGAQHYWIS